MKTAIQLIEDMANDRAREAAQLREKRDHFGATHEQKIANALFKIVKLARAIYLK